jgi:hypothetical protein
VTWADRFQNRCGRFILGTTPRDLVEVFQLRHKSELLGAIMSFDLFLMSFASETDAPANAAAARAVLTRHKYQVAPDSDLYSVELGDGSHLELSAAGLDGTASEPFTGGMLILRGLSPEICEFLFEFARAAGCVILPAMEGPTVLIPREDLAASLPAELDDRERIPINCGSDVAAALTGGDAAWQAFRDRVQRLAGDSPFLKP